MGCLNKICCCGTPKTDISSFPENKAAPSCVQLRKFFAHPYTFCVWGAGIGTSALYFPLEAVAEGIANATQIAELMGVGSIRWCVMLGVGVGSTVLLTASVISHCSNPRSAQSNRPPGLSTYVDCSDDEGGSFRFVGTGREV